LRVSTIQDIGKRFQKISAVLRLSTKYIVDTLRSSCIKYLSLTKVPTKLTVYDSRLRNEHFKYYRLAYDTRATSLLPTVFYHLSTLDIECHGLLLTVSEERYLYKGKVTLLSRYADILDELEDDLEEYDCEEEIKRVIRREKLSMMTSNALKHCDPLSRLRWLGDCDDDDDEDDEDDYLESLCGSCQANFKKSIERERKRIWNELPSIFGFGDSWKSL
jgi:hypothetical protein